MRFGIRIRTSADSMTEWPSATPPQLLIWDTSGEGSTAVAPAVRSARLAKTRLIQIDGRSTADDIVEAVRKALHVAPPSLEKLTSHETMVLLAVAAGHRNAEIARRQRRSIKTVEKHRANLQRKLGLGTVAQLTAYALRAGLLDLDTILAPRRGA